MGIKIFADGADYDGIINAARNPLIKGFTTNPTLMRQAGVVDYVDFSKNVIQQLKSMRPETNISLEVFSDEQEDMKRQAMIIADWGNTYGYDVYVKIPVMNTKGDNNYNLIRSLAKEGVKVNVTAVFTNDQVIRILEALNGLTTPTIISIFAGRIADTCVDPEEVVKDCISYRMMDVESHVEFLWASTREIFNLVQAERSGCDIITIPNDILKKLALKNKDLVDYSRETVAMFYNDALKSEFTL